MKSRTLLIAAGIAVASLIAIPAVQARTHAAKSTASGSHRSTPTMMATAAHPSAKKLTAAQKHHKKKHHKKTVTTAKH